MYHQDAVCNFCKIFCNIFCNICNFNLLLKKATAVAETSNITFLASVNFLIFLIFNMPGYTPNIYNYSYLLEVDLEYPK